MDLVICPKCERNKTALSCGICESAICKSCAQFLEPESFAFQADVSPALKHGTFCMDCYDSQVAGPVSEYFTILEAAKNIDVFFKNQGKETRLVRRKEKPVSIAACDDRDEVVMRLAFIAAAGGFDAVVDIDLKSEKVRDGSYQKLLWKGTGVPANAKGKVVNNDKSIWHNPN